MAKVGKKIGKKTQAGKDVYKTPEGKNVSEMSRTFKYKGKWINVPSIHKGYEYDVKTLKMMLDAEVIKPTSTHDSRTKAEAEARDRSDRLKFDEGGLATEEERLGFVKSYGVEPVTDTNTDLTFKDVAKTVAEFTPIIGDAMAAKEVYDELQKDEPNYLLVGALGGAALIGLIPGLGDAAAAAIKTGARKALDVGKRIEVDPDAVGSLGGNIRLKPKDQVDFDVEIAALDKAEDVITWQKNAKEAVKKRGIDLDDKKSPEALELQESARLLLENKITRDEHLANVDKLKPVGEYDQLPREPSDKALIFALDAGKRENGLFVLNDKTASKLGAKTSSLKVGDLFNSRLDIPAYKDHDTWIIAGTSPAVKAADGKGVTSYAKAVHFGGDGKPVRFIASPQRSEKIGTGVENKTGYATVSGIVKDLDADAIRAKAAELLNDPEWTQVGFDPRRQGGFYVRAGENKHVPVREATEVIQIGPLVLAKNAKLDLEYQGYSEGGMALEEQMAMNFGDVPDNTIGQDPVSGNDIPLGASAENVRDDIPANLSEGEIVVPADVVNFHGVKLFEDLRAEAKMGYAQMAEDGRMGGEPMEMDEDDIGLEFADLEIMIMPDEDMEEEPVEMYRGGRSMADYRGVTKNRAIKAPTRSAPRMTHEQVMAQARGDSSSRGARDRSPAAISARVAASAGKPKNRFEAIQQQFAKLFRDDDSASEARAKRLERVRLESKPPTSDDAEGPSIAEQINFGGDYDTEYEVTPRREKRKKAPTIQEDRARQQQEQETYSVRYADKSFAERFMEGLGFDEGGMVEEPFYDQKGGFGELDYSGIQAREYMNDQGQKIIIMFQDGVPLTPIPEGYYPVAATVTPDVDSSYNVDTVRAMTGGGSYGGAAAPAPSGRRDDPGGGDQSIRLNQASDLEPVNYKELSLEELRDMLEDQGSIKQKGILAAASAINPIMALAVRAAMWDTSRKTRAEIERRLGSPETSKVDHMRYTNMLEIAEREKPSLLDRLTGKAFEKEYSQIPSPDIPAVDFSDPTLAPDQGIAEPYTPEVTTPAVTEPIGGYDEILPQSKPFDYKAAGAKASKDAADIAFKNNPRYKETSGYTAPTTAQIQTQRDNTRDAGSSARQTFEAFRNNPSNSKSVANNAAAVQRTDSVIRDMERGVQRGFEKGGLASKKKGRKKKSK